MKNKFDAARIAFTILFFLCIIQTIFLAVKSGLAQDNLIAIMYGVLSVTYFGLSAILGKIILDKD